MLRKPPFMSWPKFLLGFFLPHSIVTMIVDWLRRPDRRVAEAVALEREHESQRTEQTFGYESAVAHLISRGLPEDAVRAGSMPESSLQRCREAFESRLEPGRALSLLHVGNFLGISLTWFADFARSWSPRSRVVAIDPNVAHRGIERPQEHVINLLRRFGLDDRVLLVTGYTMRKNLSDMPPEDTPAHFARDESCLDALPHLAALAPGSMDIAVIDGNHEPAYLRSEIAEVRKLLRPGGLLVLDDVFDWRVLAPVARQVDDSPDTTLLARDHRLGVWQVSADENRPIAGVPRRRPVPGPGAARRTAG